MLFFKLIKFQINVVLRFFFNSCVKNVHKITDIWADSNCWKVDFRYWIVQTLNGCDCWFVLPTIKDWIN